MDCVKNDLSIALLRFTIIIIVLFLLYFQYHNHYPSITYIYNLLLLIQSNIIVFCTNTNQFNLAQMPSAIAPITGRFKYRIIRDLVASTSIGTVLAFAYWNNVTLPAQREWKQYHDKVQLETKQIHDDWKNSL